MPAASYKEENRSRSPTFVARSPCFAPLETLPAPPLALPTAPALPHRHFMLHKPYGCLSQFRSEFKGERNKQFLGALHDFPPGTMAIGRLDEASEGLLLLTTDGALSAQVRSPGIEKEYYAQVDGLVTDEALAQLRTGFTLRTADGATYQTAPSQARRLAETPAFAPRIRKIRDERHGPTSWLAIVLTEGKFRQVRRMTAAVGLPTLRLVRMRVGGVWLDGLAPGEACEVAAFAGCGG